MFQLDLAHEVGLVQISWASPPSPRQKWRFDLQETVHRSGLAL